MMVVLTICLVGDGNAYDLLKAFMNFISKSICQTFVLAAPTKAHGECDAKVIEEVHVSYELSMLPLNNYLLFLLVFFNVDLDLFCRCLVLGFV